MNYIEKFLNDNGIVIGTPFQISLSPRLWFCFTDDYRLDLLGDDDVMRAWTDFDNILMRLLLGQIAITKVMGE